MILLQVPEGETPSNPLKLPKFIDKFFDALQLGKSLNSNLRFGYYSLVLADILVIFFSFFLSDWPTPGFISFLIIMHFAVPALYRIIDIIEKIINRKL